LNCCASKASRPVHECDDGPETKKINMGRSSTVFIPSEGIFRTTSPPPEESPWISPAKKTMLPPAILEHTQDQRVPFSYARSLAQGTLTPRKQMVQGGVRRDISAPSVRSGNIRDKSQARA